MCPQFVISLLILRSVSWTCALRVVEPASPAPRGEAYVNVHFDRNVQEGIHVYTDQGKIATGMSFFRDVQLHLNLYHGEFGEDMLMVVPFAYHLHLKGKVASTTGCGNLAAFYWWSPNHTDILDCHRMAGGEKYITNAITVEIGEIFENRPTPDTFTMPPHLEHYFKMPPLNTQHDYMNSPTQLAIFNKYEWEWNEAPVNFLGSDELQDIISAFRGACGPKAGVVYVSSSSGLTPGMAQDAQDMNASSLHSGLDIGGKTDVDWMRSQRVDVISDVFAQNAATSGNEVKMRLMTRTRCFVSVQGGGGVISMLFGGKVLLYHRRGREDKFPGQPDKSMYVLAKKFSGAEVTQFRDKTKLVEEFKALVNENFCAACSKREKVERHELPMPYA